MSVEYSGTIVNNEQYRVKKLQNQMNALLVAYNSLAEENDRLKEKLKESDEKLKAKVDKPAQPVNIKATAKKKRTRRTPQQMAAARA